MATSSDSLDKSLMSCGANAPNAAMHRTRRCGPASSTGGEHRGSRDGRRGAPVMAKPLARRSSTLGVELGAPRYTPFIAR